MLVLFRLFVVLGLLLAVCLHLAFLFVCCMFAVLFLRVCWFNLVLLLYVLLGFVLFVCRFVGALLFFAVGAIDLGSLVFIWLRWFWGDFGCGLVQVLCFVGCCVCCCLDVCSGVFVIVVYLCCLYLSWIV